jgi:hypothetical protein
MVAATIGALLILALAIAARSQGRGTTSDSPAVHAPHPCVVGSQGCGPLPTVPRHGIRMYHFDRAAAANGLLRPGAYDSIWKNNALHLGFAVGRGWSWNGRTLSKGNAAVSFYLAPVLVYADPCHWDQPQHPVVKPALASGDVIISELAAQPMRYAAHPKGVPAYMRAITLTVPRNLDISRCDHAQYRTWGTGAHTLLAQGPGQRDLIWITYLGLSGKTLIVDATTFPSTLARLVRQVDAILASIGACASCG